MAELAGLVLSVARDMLSLIVECGTLLKDLPEEVQNMRDELQNIQTFIYETDRSNATEEVKEKLKHLVKRAFRLEDIIDKYMITKKWEPARIRTAYKLKHFKWVQKDYGFQIPSSSEPGQTSSGGNQDAAVQNLQLAPLFLKEDDVVGFESPKGTLIDWLVEGKEARTVVSVVAMGGQGKTTLARQVFNNQQVIGHFPYRAWVTVSQSYTVEGLLRSMLQEFYKEQEQTPPENLSTMDRGLLITQVRNYLNNKKYVVFFDDVWNTHFWDDIELALIDDKVGSRVFITTRDVNVADSCKRSSFVQLYELQPLTQEKSIELFCKKAFFELNGCCPHDLMDISSEIVSKCKGLPLAIVAIGGVLACRKADVSEWRSFSQNLSSELERDSRLDSIRKVLCFSYDDLPTYLKPCYLYFGMYPEDYEVTTTRLTRQWIAEGFVKEERGKSLEKVAEGYLMELVRRSLVQASWLSIDGRVKGSRVHDLLREMIQRKFEDLSFAHFISEDDRSASIGKSRRLSISANSNSFMTSTESSNIRSLLFFVKEETIQELLGRIIPANCKLLKVLDLQSPNYWNFYYVPPENHVPENLGTLIHLRYLSIGGRGIKSLPETICKLENLETLDVGKSAAAVLLPKEISRLRKLRHLDGSFKFNPLMKDSVGGMTSLQTLCYLSLEDDEAGELIKELGKLSQLRVLGLERVREGQGSALCSSLNKMQQLEELSVYVTQPDEVIDLHLISTLPLLRSLQLLMKLNKLPEWVPSLQYLVQLTLIDSELTVDPFTSLQNLPNLLRLWLIENAYAGDTLHAHDGGFPKLKHLDLYGLHILEFLRIDRGAMPYLENFLLWDVPKLNEVPSGIQHLNNLKRVELREPGPFDFEDNKQRQIIQHVPLVSVFDKDYNHTRFEFGEKKACNNAQPWTSGLRRGGSAPETRGRDGGVPAWRDDHTVILDRAWFFKSLLDTTLTILPTPSTDKFPSTMN